MTGRIENYQRSRELQKKAHRLIPAGCHTYSKGDDQFPQNAPVFIERAKGVTCWDVDGNQFLDWGMGLRSVILGHGYPAVLDAVRQQIEKGTNFTRPAPIEVEFAEQLVELIPSAEMVKFAKNGSDVTSAAVRLARAYTGRDYIARCRENPFFSFYDWFIGDTAPNAGIPAEISALTLQFSYNHIESLRALFEQHPGQIAAVILEAVSIDPPEPGFLEQVKEITQRNGAVLIFDEMISGFRWHLRGAQAYFGVTPDLSTFGKAIGNGFSVAALVGKREIMELGGIYHNKPKVFLLSATHGAETHSLAAASVTLHELVDQDVPAHLWRIGGLLQDSLRSVIAANHMEKYIQVVGYPCSPAIVCRDHRGEVSMPFRTLFLQEMIARGVLIPYISPSFSHTQREVEQTCAALSETLPVYARAIDQGSVEGLLVGPAVKPVFRKYN